MLRIIIIDDETRARNLLEYQLRRLPVEMEIVAKCADMESGVTAIKLHQPDLILLDIEMPNYSGLELLSFIPKPEFAIIFVTAYDQYAVRAFELAALDYLLKPVDPVRLEEAIARVIEKTELQKRLTAYASNAHERTSPRQISIPHKGGYAVENIEEIICVEANRSYATLYFLPTKKYTIAKSLNVLEELLNDSGLFLRIHRSWLVNRQQIIHHNKSEQLLVMSNDMKLPISKANRKMVGEALSY